MKYFVVRNEPSTMDAELRGLQRVLHDAGWAAAAHPEHSEVTICFGRPTRMDWARLLETVDRRCKLLLIEPPDEADTGPLHWPALDRVDADRLRTVRYRRKAEFIERTILALRELRATPPAHAGQQPEALDWPAPLGANPYGKPVAAGGREADGPAIHGREWLKQALVDWAKGAEERPLLLLASAGNGKTTMLEWFRAQAERQGQVVISHFCSHDREQTLRPGQIIQSLALQMADKVRGYRRTIENSPEAQRALYEAEADPVTAWLHCVHEPLVRLQFDGALLLLDALDESRELSQGPGREGAKTLLELLAARTFKPPKGLRVLVSSRPIDDISRLQGDFDRIELDGEANSGDIGSYVACRIDATPTLAHYLELSGKTAPDLSAKLAAQGNFLLAKNLLDALSTSAEFREIPYDSLPLAHDGYYYDSFKRRVEPQLNDLQRKHLPDFLASVAVVREPLSCQAHAHILGLASADVQSMYDAMSGLLVHPGRRSSGVTFYHPTLEDWLRGKDGARPGTYGIDAPAAERRLLEWCSQLAAGNWIDAPQNRTAEAATYLQQFGVDLLVAGAHFGHALHLLAALRRLPETPRQWELQCDRLLRRLEQRWFEFDSRGDRSQELKTRSFREEIDLADVVSLLSSMDYETGKYVALFRTVLEFHPDWGTLLQGLLRPSGEDGENDIVFRNDVGVAYAQSWLSAQTAVGMDQQATATWQAMEQMAGSSDEHAREIAAYCFKHLCQRARAWSYKEPELGRLWARYAASEHPTDRMVAGEMAVALAAHGKDVRDWSAAPHRTQGFWRPVWPNHRADLFAWALLLQEKGVGATDQWSCAELEARAAGDFEWRSAREQSRHAFELRRQLAAGPWMKSPLGQQLKLPLTPAEQQSAGPRLRLEDTLDQLRAAWRNEALRPDLLAFFQLLMLHPLWNVTELGASLLSDIWKREASQAHEMLDQLQAIADREPLLWRLRYGLIDAAYNAGATHGYDRFTDLVLAWGATPEEEAASCRVQGICADDLLGWIEEAPVEEVRAWLGKPEAKALLANWIATAKDIWLLEYLHSLLNELRRHRDDGTVVIGFTSVFELTGAARLSEYLRGAVFGQPEDGFFADIPPDKFLLAVDALRRQEQAQTGAAAAAAAAKS